MNSLKNIHSGLPVYIIGKGPSLHNLEVSHIGDGIIITINDAINKVEGLNLPNIIYSMQKDGLQGKLIPHDCKEHSIMPKRSILLVHKHESLLCYPDYSPRIVFDNLELGLKVNDFSALSAIKLAQLMGCTKFYFVSFDACNNQDGGQYQVENRPIRSIGYFRQCEKMKPYLDIDYSWITPEKKTVRGDIDVVYALGSGSRWHNNEICYSLRSIEKHVKGWRNIFIVGMKPAQLGHIIHIPADDLLTNNADGNIARKVLLACADKRVSDTFLFINDDHLFLKDINILDIPAYNKGDLKKYDDSFYDNGGLYVKRLKRTKDVLLKNKLPTLHYDCHTPILIDKNRFPGIIRKFDFESGIGYTMKSLYGNSLKLPSPYLADLNVKTPMVCQDIVAAAADHTLMAYNDAGLNQDLKKFLNDTFPNKSKFEIMEKQRQLALGEAQQWLENPKKSYKEGVRIYSQIGRDKRLLSRFKQINSEMMMQKLLSELTKLRDILLKEGVQPLMSTAAAQAKSATPPPPKSTGRIKVDTNPTIDINLLPDAERALYEQNQELTREISVLHAKVKLTEDRDERKKLAQELTHKEDLRAENWQKLDDWWKNHTSGKKQKEITDPSGKYTKDVIEGIGDPAVKALSRELRIKANTNYIKRFKASEKPAQIKEVAIRIREMSEWDVKVKE